MAKKARRGHKANRKTRGLSPKQRLRRETNPSRAKVTPDIEEDDKVLVNNPIPSVPRGRGDSGQLLTDPHRLRSDIKLVEQAIKRGYNVRRKTMIRRRLEAIANKETADVVTKTGMIDSESKADELAIAAIKVLVEMDKTDIKRFEALKETPTQGPTVQVNVVNNVNPDADPRRARLIELANRLGARELSIDAEQVNLTSSDSGASEVQGKGSEEVTDSWAAKQDPNAKAS